MTLGDVSPAALRVARQNVGSQRLSGRVKCLTIDVRQPAAPFLGTFDLIVSNPPYVTTAEMETLDPSVRDYEPHLALWGGDDGLDFYRAIVRNFTPRAQPRRLALLRIRHGSGRRRVRPAAPRRL